MAIHWSANARAVQVDDMETWCAQFLPPASDRDGVVAVRGLAVVVALDEADAAALAEVYRWDDFEAQSWPPGVTTAAPAPGRATSPVRTHSAKAR
ncbi:MAG: hypothetical protein Kow0010_06920 [Dehalococcoidia bacterium]